MRTKNKIDAIIKKLSLDHRIPVKDVKDAIDVQFLFVRHIIESSVKDEEDTFKTVQLPSFGKFIAEKMVIRRIVRHKNKRDGNKSK